MATTVMALTFDIRTDLMGQSLWKATIISAPWYFARRCCINAMHVHTDNTITTSHPFLGHSSSLHYCEAHVVNLFMVCIN